MPAHASALPTAATSWRGFAPLVLPAWLALALLACTASEPARAPDSDGVFVPDLGAGDTAPMDGLLGSDLADTWSEVGSPDLGDTQGLADLADLADELDEAAPPEEVAPGDAGPDTSPPPDPATCPVPAMSALYPGPIPPIPYAAWPLAEGCVAAPHDVVIVLGCPSNGDGSPSRCQDERAAMADQLVEAGLASNFIVTGAAVHNAHIEADALAELLVARGQPRDRIVKEPLARHTDENLYYSTRLMQERGWRSALVVSDDPGHLMMTALCDTNCCVKLGLMTLYEYEVAPLVRVKVGHYALYPDAPSPMGLSAQCDHLADLFMCTMLSSRLACADDFRL